MNFWDSSALVTLHVAQDSTALTRALYVADPDVVAWTLSDVEMHSALRRLEREGLLVGNSLVQAIRRLDLLWETLAQVPQTSAVKSRAKRLLANHPLRAADALQLAAALVACRDEPVGNTFISLDNRLCTAAAREGFTVLPES
jgi:hypothetical protein